MNARWARFHPSRVNDLSTWPPCFSINALQGLFRAHSLGPIILALLSLYIKHAVQHLSTAACAQPAEHGGGWMA